MLPIGPEAWQAQHVLALDLLVASQDVRLVSCEVVHEARFDDQNVLAVGAGHEDVLLLCAKILGDAGVAKVGVEVLVVRGRIGPEAKDVDHRHVHLLVQLHPQPLRHPCQNGNFT